MLSESVDGRPALILHDDARRSSVVRLHWTGRMRVDGDATALDGVNRVPGLIRNCGGDATDEPTSQPRHDFTCTDAAELVAFSRHYGASTPAGPGREVVVDHGVVASVSESRGTALTRGQHSVQATGSDTDLLAGVQVGDRLRLRLRLMSRGARLRTPSGTTVTNGGPLLMRNGSIRVTQRRDGFVRPNDPSFAYGFVIKRNPRTLAGIDAKRRTVLVTVDGRSADDLGLSVREAADVARSLGPGRRDQPGRRRLHDDGGERRRHLAPVGSGGRGPLGTRCSSHPGEGHRPPRLMGGAERLTMEV